ncbi:MAG TPA: molybdopterin-dependent oxidoreductase [Candidatus Dormibacteraeota bacterium]
MAGLAILAVIYILAGLIGFPPLPEILQQPLLNILPGPVFGFLIDTLQHAGKVLEEFGIIVGLVVLAGAVGAVVARLRGAGAGAGADADPGRRDLMKVGVAGVSAAVLGVRLIPGWAQSVLHPAESGLGGISPEITPAGHFYVVSKNFQDPVLAADGWHLQVAGLVARPLTLDYQGLLRLPATTELVTMECISNDVGGDLISTGRFTGVSLRDLVQMADPQGGATAVNFSANDGYTETLPLAVVTQSPEILVAYMLDEAPLPTQHGFPARILIPGRYGMKGPKWLERVELAASPRGGYWEDEGWDHDAVVKTTSRIDTPAGGALVHLQPVVVGGVAFAGKRGISSVEVSFDGGHTWRAADVQPPLSAFTWNLWRTTWHPTAEGGYTLVVRARDGSGALQTPSGAGSFPSGASGYHSVQVTAAH